MSDRTTYYQRNREIILNRAKEKNEVLREQVRNKYRELSEEEKKNKNKIWKK